MFLFLEYAVTLQKLPYNVDNPMTQTLTYYIKLDL